MAGSLVAPVASSADERPRPGALWRAYPLGADADEAAARVSRPAARLGAVPEYPGGPAGPADGRLMLQLGILFALLYVGFLTVWFSTVRRPAPVGPRRWSRRAERAPAPAVSRSWRCEIGWRPGRGQSRFQAVMLSPDSGSRRVVAESEGVPWPPGDVRRPPARELEAALGSLVASMVSAGWEPIQSGGSWAERRFVWRGEGEPPRRVEPTRKQRGTIAGESRPARRSDMQVVEHSDTPRADLLRRAAFSGAAVLGGAATWSLSQLTFASPSAEQDARVLNLVLTLEHLKAAFYREALERAGLHGELEEFAQVAGEHEKSHVAVLMDALGGAAEPAPHHDFGDRLADADAFAATAVELEDLAVAAYNGQGVNLTTPSLKAAARIVSVEGRHAAWIRSIIGKVPATEPTDALATEDEIRARLREFGVDTR